MTIPIRVTLCLASVLAVTIPAAAQERRAELSGQFVAVHSGQFDQADSGIGVRFSWRVTPLVTMDAETSLFPAAFADAPAFSRRRSEFLFGATAGPRLGAFRVFGKARTGVVRFQGAPEPFACITIFPPPLACTLANGATAFALDLGGGLEWLSERSVLRVELSDRPIRYPGPAWEADGTRRDGGFFSHDLRMAAGAGWRF